jgi:alkanesulfonate monooxygenase SsuD/methylene tetrahydromethanopterin reductase-like flavin-dependent oxidoreductase (luciferase family)
VRIGVTLPPGDEVGTAVAAESLGVPFVHLAAAPGTEAAIAAAVAVATTTVRILVGLGVGDENPVTLAEEIAVVDNVSNGRLGVIAEIGALPAEAATEDVAVLRASWSGRPVAHRGARWKVPAGLPEHVAPPAVMVTPQPAQLEVPLWVAGAAARSVAGPLSLPWVAGTPADVDGSATVAPARTELTGNLEDDREHVIEWSRAGATHLLCTLSGPATIEALQRRLQPEVAMVAFPRLITQTPLPESWPPLQT